MDATMEALRLVSEGSESRVGGLEDETAITRDAQRDPRTWLNGNPLPSKEVLLTLLWALRVEERKLIQKCRLPQTPSTSETSTQLAPANIYTYTLMAKAPLLKRQGDSLAGGDGEKRLRTC